jgi:hypothetical protein
MLHFSRLTRLTLLAALALLSASAAAEPRLDPRYPFRTDFANEHLPWYQPKPLEFPPYHSDHRVGGELVAADFIHRCGVFRMNGTGQLVSFTMPHFGVVHALNGPADLRDVPLGTGLLFFLYQDASGEFTRATAMQDDFTMSANHHFNYRLEALKLDEGKLVVTRQKIPAKETDAKEADAKSSEWLVTSETRVWKGDTQGTLADLVVGDELLANFSGSNPQHPRRCTDVWVGVETHRLATEKQRERHAKFVKQRGLPAWIVKVEGKQILVDLLGSDEPADRNAVATLLAAEFPVGKSVQTVVANDELRSYWPPVDGKRSQLVKVESTPSGVHGSVGLRLTLEPTLMLEGFRTGRMVRLFAEKWPVADMPFGEGLNTEMSSMEVNEVAPKEYPAQFPYRTDFGNAELEWYQLRTGEIPPRYSEHIEVGELLGVDVTNRRGQFREGRSGRVVDFSLTAEGAFVYFNTNVPENTGPIRWDSLTASVMYLGTPAELEDLPIGTRCAFHLYKDDKGEFTRASLVSDEFSALVLNKVSWRIDALNLREGHIEVARRLPPRKQPRLSGYDQAPDIGRAWLVVTPETRVWKGTQQVNLSDLCVGEELFANRGGETATEMARCTDLWVGSDSQKIATEAQRKKHEARLKQRKTEPPR